MRIALITPLVDPRDPLLGFIHTWVLRLAQRVDHLTVLQLWRSNPPLPSNVTLRSLDRNGPGGRVAALARLTSTLASLCWQGRVDGVIAHMGPIFAVSAAPVVKLGRIPLALWYAHGTVSPMLRLAHALVDRAGTSSPDGLRIHSKKITITGQGIDTDRFKANSDRDQRLVVSIGRISPVKHYEVVIDAMAALRERGLRDLRLRIIGGATLPGELSYRTRLEEQIRARDLAGSVEIVPGVPHDRVAPEYQRAALFVSCSQTGSMDKAVLEAASAGALPITTNPAFRSFFRQELADHLPRQGVDSLTDLLARWLERPATEREERSLLLRNRVVREHGIDHLADELVNLVRPISPHKASPTGSSELT
ncbi:MAG TPA: glycosyltransferase family 4 protein [Chloroflexota bacterium]|nr:glycosyltransferase family 4 protein [Chloroflexota bacterium]